MSALRLTLAVLLLTGMALAGCSTKPSSGPGGTDSSSLQGVHVSATSTTGIIRGVVVDTAVRPVAGVQLSVKAGDKTLTTNSTAAGGFGFQGLDPGTYFVKAHKAGYNDAQASAEVKANDDNPSLVRIGLEPNPSTRAYVDALVFKGFIECSTTTVAVSFAACSAPNGATCGLDPVPCSGNVTNDNFLVHYQPQRVPTWVQSEMIWTSTQSLGDELNMQYSWDCGNDNAGFLCDHGARGTSPLMINANETWIKKIGIGNSTDVYIRVFNTWNDATMPPGTCAPELPAAGTRCLRGIGATTEQDFTIYTHIFYGFAPPDGWRFSKDGDPKVPA
jgi:hypothetical protein